MASLGYVVRILANTGYGDLLVIYRVCPTRNVNPAFDSAAEFIFKEWHEAEATRDLLVRDGWTVEVFIGEVKVWLKA
jgi:hypothetical protein